MNALRVRIGRKKRRMTRRKERRASMEGGKKTILAGESGNEFYLQLANY